MELQKEVTQGRQAITEEVCRQRGFNFYLADHLDSVKDQVALEFNRHLRIMEDLDAKRRLIELQVEHLKNDSQAWERREQETTEWYSTVEEKVDQMDTSLQDREGRTQAWATKAEEAARTAQADGQSARIVYSQLVQSQTGLNQQIEALKHELRLITEQRNAYAAKLQEGPTGTPHPDNVAMKETLEKTKAELELLKIQIAARRDGQPIVVDQNQIEAAIQKQFKESITPALNTHLAEKCQEFRGEVDKIMEKAKENMDGMQAYALQQAHHQMMAASENIGKGFATEAQRIASVYIKDIAQGTKKNRTLSTQD